MTAEELKCRYGQKHQDICGCYQYNQWEIEGLDEKLVLAEAKIEELKISAWELVSHPAFGIGTKSNEEIPKGIMARVNSLKTILERP